MIHRPFDYGERRVMWVFQIVDREPLDKMNLNMTWTSSFYLLCNMTNNWNWEVFELKKYIYLIEKVRPTFKIIFWAMSY